MQDSVSPPAPRRARLYWPFALLAFLALGWSAFWFYAASRTESTLGAWIEREASHGRVWTCPQRQTGGYPFRIEVTCATPTFAGPAGKARVEGSLGALKAYAQAWAPNHILADLNDANVMIRYLYISFDRQTSSPIAVFSTTESETEAFLKGKGYHLLDRF